MKVADADGKVTRTLDRSTLWAAQTPQFATARDLRRAHAEAVRHGQPPATDDAALLERAGFDVVIVESSPENFKVTLPGDLARAEALLRERGEDGAAEEEILVVECFVDPRAVDHVLLELEARDARVDEIDRDLPSATVIRAYATRAALRGFGARLHALAGEDALFTTHLSHHAPRSSARRWTASTSAVHPHFRVGHGFDAHRLVEGRPFVLGGVRIEHDKGPLGHSDADVLVARDLRRAARARARSAISARTSPTPIRSGRTPTRCGCSRRATSWRCGTAGRSPTSTRRSWSSCRGSRRTSR